MCDTQNLLAPRKESFIMFFFCVCLLSELFPVKNFYSLHRFPKVKKKKAEGGIVTWKPE